MDRLEVVSEPGKGTSVHMVRRLGNQEGWPLVRQAELIRQAQDGDKKARDKVVSDNLGLVHAIVRRFEKEGMTGRNCFRSDVSG